jgi:hypothetical protein
LEVRVEPLVLPLTEALAQVEGVQNALSIETDTVQRVLVSGPGAGREQAGQGLFADLAAVARSGGPRPVRGPGGRGAVRLAGFSPLMARTLAPARCARRVPMWLAGRKADWAGLAIWQGMVCG